MHAQSFVWSVREIDDCLIEINAQPRLAGTRVTLGRSHRARELLAHVTRLLANTNLIQPSPPWQRDDDALGTLLVSMYTEGTRTAGQLRESLDEGVFERLHQRQQIRTHDGQVVVPLDAKTGSANWPPLLGLLLDWTTELVSRTEQVVEKLRADNVGERARELWLVESLLDRLEVLRAEIRRIRGALQLLNSTVTIDRRLHDIVTEVLPAMFQDNSEPVELEAVQ